MDWDEGKEIGQEDITYLRQRDALGSIGSREAGCEGKESNEDGLKLSLDRSNERKEARPTYLDLHLGDRVGFVLMMFLCGVGSAS